MYAIYDLLLGTTANVCWNTATQWTHWSKTNKYNMEILHNEIHITAWH